MNESKQCVGSLFYFLAYHLCCLDKKLLPLHLQNVLGPVA